MAEQRCTVVTDNPGHCLDKGEEGVGRYKIFRMGLHKKCGCAGTLDTIVPHSRQSVLQDCIVSGTAPRMCGHEFPLDTRKAGNGLLLLLLLHCHCHSSAS